MLIIIVRTYFIYAVTFSESLNCKLFDHTKQSASNAFKTYSKRVIRKIAEAKGDLIDNRIADKITRVSKTSPKNYSETNEEEIH